MLTSRRSDAPYLSQADRVARRKAIAHARLNNDSIATVMERFGVSRTTVVAACREFDAKPPWTPRKPSTGRPVGAKARLTREGAVA